MCFVIVIFWGPPHSAITTDESNDDVTSFPHTPLYLANQFLILKEQKEMKQISLVNEGKINWT